MRKITNLTAFLIVFISLSFNTTQPDERNLTGTYGICSETEDGPTAKFDLTLNADHTFRYYNAISSNTIIDLSGTYTFDGKYIVLHQKSANTRFHAKWKFNNRDHCITSRKGLEFSRLCNVQFCR